MRCSSRSQSRAARSKGAEEQRLKQGDLLHDRKVTATRAPRILARSRSAGMRKGTADADHPYRRVR